MQTTESPSASDRIYAKREQHYIRLGESLRETLRTLENAQIMARRIWTKDREYREALERLTGEVREIYTTVDKEYAGEFGAPVGKFKSETKYSHTYGDDES